VLTERQTPQTPISAEEDFREALRNTLDRCARRLSETPETGEDCDRAYCEASRLLLDSMRQQLRAETSAEEPEGGCAEKGAG